MFRKLMVALLFVSVAAFAQQKPKPKPVASDPCADEKQPSWLEGFKLADQLSAIYAGDTSGKFHMKILTEDLNGADAYRFAVAEVIRQHFAENIVVDPNASLLFYISGAQTKEVNAQQIEFSIFAYTPRQLVVGSTYKNILGKFVAEEDGGILVNAPLERRTQFVRETTYSLLSKLLADWQSAGTK